MTVYICDWTHWQSRVLPATQVETEGFSMVKLKAGGSQTVGPFFVDPFFLESAHMLRQTSMLMGVYWYLMPGYPAAQAAILYDLLTATGGHTAWKVFLDVEQRGVSYRDLTAFHYAWQRLTNSHPLHIYTSKRFWEASFGPAQGSHLFFVLEEAHWVSSEIRHNDAKPYASQHVKGIDPGWWTVNYGGWERARMIQFTDRALVAGKQVPCSVFPGTKAELSTLLS